ncbi:hypothetical protein EDO6_02992 [Paenibacillus xylanexedens]|nr:hypothetical protein EDO6_02992 [Paenibacillus xylanexedens]
MFIYWVERLIALFKAMSDTYITGRSVHDLGAPMKCIEISKLAPFERMKDRGW